MKYIGSREVSEMVGVDLEYFQNKFIFDSGLIDIAYRFTAKGAYKWLLSDIDKWKETKRVKRDKNLTSDLQHA
jgi:hypothetical protein